MTGVDWLDGTVDLVLYVLAYATGVAAHEGGHFLAALLLGLGPRAVYIGKGPLVARRRVGRVWVILHAVPVTGLVVAPSWFGRPLARFIFVAAGPGTNLVLLGLGVLGLSAGTPLVTEPALAVVVAHLTLLVGTLVPHRFKARGREVPSDGLQLFLMLTGKRVDTLTPLHATLLKPFLAPGEPLPEPSRHLPEIAFQVGRPERLREGWAVLDAQDALRWLLAAPDLPSLERAFVLTFLAGNELAFGGTGADASELDAWSAEALALAPVPYTRVIRGGTLVALGRAGKARALLLAALDADLVPADRFFASAFLGQAEAALGEVETAWRRFAEARALPAARAGAFPQILDRWEAALPKPPATPSSGVPRIGLRVSQGAAG